MSGFRSYLMLADGERADPAMFVSAEPPGIWKVGDTFFSRDHRTFRILDIQGAPEGGNGAPWAVRRMASGTVEPV